MIDKVILYDIKCGKKYISTLQARQILGRAGRTYNKFQQGQTYIFGKQQDKQKINQYYYGDDNNVYSNLNTLDKIAFHILPDILSKKILNKDNIKKWLQNTLFFAQGNVIDYIKIYDYLIEKQCIDTQFNVLPIGNLSIQYYYTPQRIHKLLQKMKYLQQLDDFSITALSWMFSYYQYNVKIFHPLYEQFSNSVSSKYYVDKQMNDFFVYFLILNGRTIKKLLSYLLKTKKDFFRLIGMTKKLSDIYHIDIINKLKSIENMLYYNVSYNGSMLMQQLNCYDAILIKQLIGLQIFSYKDLKYNIEFIEQFYGQKTYQKCKKIMEEKGE